MFPPSTNPPQPPSSATVSRATVSRATVGAGRSEPHLQLDLPSTEDQRLETLDRYGLLETPSVASFDRITKLAARCLVAPVAFIAWVDRDAIRLASRQGLEVATLPRPRQAETALLADGVRWYDDLTNDATLQDPSLKELAQRHGVRFLATAPLSTYNGQLLGALCVADVEPRAEDSRRRRELEELAGSLMKQVEARRLYHQLGRRAALREARHAQKSRCATPAQRPTDDRPRLATDRRALLRRIGRRLESARHRRRNLERTAALLLFDLRGFGALNAQLGYAAGDRVLKEVGRRLLAVKNRRDTAIHLGGDSFGLLMVDLDSPEAAGQRLRELEALLSSPLQIGEVSWEPTADLALVAVDPQRHRFADDVLAEAEATVRSARSKASQPSQSTIAKPDPGRCPGLCCFVPAGTRSPSGSPSPEIGRGGWGVRAKAAAEIFCDTVDPSAKTAVSPASEAQVSLPQTPLPQLPVVETTPETTVASRTSETKLQATSDATLRILANEELDLEYRPLIDAPSGRLRGFEARLRFWPPSDPWTRPAPRSPASSSASSTGY